MLRRATLGSRLLFLEIFKNSFGVGRATNSIQQLAKTVSLVAKCLGPSTTMYEQEQIPILQPVPD
jgi:hypothetical protein